MKDRAKILIVDDRLNNLIALEKNLKEIDADFVRALSGNDALREILKHDFALAILDVQMPEMDGYELARLIREREQTRHLPIIFLSAIYSDDFHIFKGYGAGAVDFITKPYNPEIMSSKILFFIEIYKQQLRLRESILELEESRKCIQEQNELLEMYSTHDDLTGLYNRRYFVATLKQEFYRSRRYDSDLSIIMLDLDHFKSVNDTFGHEFGDYILKAFANRMLSSFRESDFVFRFGGEEFIALLPQTGIAGAITVAEKIRRTCAEEPFKEGPHSKRVTVSIGVASYKDHQPQHRNDLISYADKALYAAKAKGKNRVVVYETIKSI